MEQKNFEEWLTQHRSEFAPVVPLEKTDKMLRMDFTAANTELTEEVLKDTNQFIRYVNEKLQKAGAKYGVGGYNEHRTIYTRSGLFGPSPTTSPEAQDAAKAPSPREEGKRFFAYQWADPVSYKLLKEYAEKHRQQPTQAEEVFWNMVQSKSLQGFKFRRQHIIGNYIADFVCLKKNLIVEIDGLIHQLPDHKASDAERTALLNLKGFSVIRYSNDEVLFETDKVLQSVLIKLNELSDFSESSNLSSPLGGQGAGEARRLHLGIDIWGKPHTKVMAPLDGIVHSFAFNNAFGDYGATIILTHNLAGVTFHTLYGHLSLNSLKNLREGDGIRKGDVFADFGIPFENGQWPPHLHFQLIRDMQGMKGDYPGVCAYSEKEIYLENCPDADCILNIMSSAVQQ